jgi:hypothetical protein
MIIGKKYDIDGEVKEVINEDDSFAHFSGGVAIKKYLLGTKYEEYLDPSTFFNNSKTMMDIANKIKQHDGPVNESHTGTQVNMQNVYQKPHAEDAVVPPVQKFDPNRHNQNSYQTQEYEFNNQQNTQQHHVQNVNTNSHNHVPQNNQQTYQHVPPVQENPEEALFKKLKRNTKAVFELKVEEMVPTTDFIRMMNDNFEMSIIDFLSKQAVDKLLRDPEKLRKQIKDQLETTVYGAPREEEIVEEEIIEQPKVSIIENPVEEIIDEKPVVSIIEETIEEVEKPTVTVIESSVEESIDEKPVVSVIQETHVEEPANEAAPNVETNENDLSAEEHQDA